MISPTIRRAVDAVRAAFPDAGVEETPDGSDGVFVVVDPVEVSDVYTPTETWLGFQINSAYPHSDVYPHYIGRLERVDGGAHGEGIQAVDWQGRQALQLSRRSNRWNPQRDNAALKAQKVLAWLTSQ